MAAQEESPLDLCLTATPVASSFDDANVEALAPAVPVVRELAMPAHVFWTLTAAANQRPDLEVCCPYGGVVLPDGTLVVLDLTGPGCLSTRTWASCDYDPPAVQGWLDSKHSVMPYFNIAGTIHTHPGSSFASGQDVESFAAWITDPEHNPDGNRYAAVYGIVGRDGSGLASDLRVYYVDEGALDPVQLPWRLLDPADPLHCAAIDFAVDGVWRPQEASPRRAAVATSPVTGSPRPTAPTEPELLPAAPDLVAVVAWRLAQVGLDLVVAPKPSGLQHWRVLDDGRPVLTCVYAEGQGNLLLFDGERVSRKARLAVARDVDAAAAVVALATSREARRVARRDTKRAEAGRLPRRRHRTD